MVEREVDATANLHRVRGNEGESGSEMGKARKNERQALYIYRAGKSRGSYVKRRGTGNTPRKR